MNEKLKCNECGIELADDAAEGLCPKRLMQQAMASVTDLTDPKPGTSSVESDASKTLDPALGVNIRYFGDYELLEEIARGGMGVVYKARQRSLNRIVALKMILSGELASDDQVKRFHGEAESAANLQHPNIVAIHEIGVHEDRHYFTMDYVEGHSLDKITDGKPLSAKRAAVYLKTIAEAIQFAHQRGILHRDLKPQNILIDNLDHVRITDFGLAKQFQQQSSLTMTGTVMGSPSYMPPEQAQGRRDLIGSHSDVYSLGAILYELLTGRPPFSGASPVKTMMKVIEEEPVAPGKLNESVPVDLETICLKCLEKSPQRRYPTARALAEELDRFLKGEPIQARPSSAIRKIVNWGRRHQWITTATMSAVILILFGLVYGLWEQTKYLTYINAHPEYVRVKGQLLLPMAVDSFFSIIVLLVVQFGYCRYLMFSRQWDMKDVANFLLKPAESYKPATRISSGWTAAFIVLGLTGIFYSFYLATTCIRAFVWEGWSSSNFGSVLIFLFFNLIMGLRILVTVISEQTSASLGLQNPADVEQLPADEFRQICDALQSGFRTDAINLYGKFTGASIPEAKIRISQMEIKLHREQPEKFPADPSKPPKLDVKKIYILTFFLFIVVSLGSFILPKNLIFDWPVIFLVGTANLFMIEISMRISKISGLSMMVFTAIVIVLSFMFLRIFTSQNLIEVWLVWLSGYLAGKIITTMAIRKNLIKQGV